MASIGASARHRDVLIPFASVSVDLVCLMYAVCRPRQSRPECPVSPCDLENPHSAELTAKFEEGQSIPDKQYMFRPR